jgi:quercetin dioxygenase-like cupin family protein
MTDVDSEKTVPRVERKSFDMADEVRTPYEYGRVDVLKVGNVRQWDAKRVTIQPGWLFSKHTAPLTGTELCEIFHVKLFLRGRFGVRMRDGTEMEFGPGDIGVIDAGHDAWVSGDEACAFIDLAEVARQTGGTP